MMLSSRPLAVIMMAGAVIAAAACSTTSPFVSRLDSWRGAPVHELLAAWGPPALKGRDLAGRQTVIYEMPTSVDAVREYASAGPWPGRLPPNRGCRVAFTLDPQGQIVASAARGQDCESR